MKRIFLPVLCAVIACSVYCEKAYAEAHTHDGFFLRLAPGLGWMSTSEKYAGDKLETSGSSGLFNFAIGGAVAENLIVHFDMTSVSTSDPKVKINGVSSTSYGDLSTSLIGIGLTKYFSSNAYLTGVIGIANTEFESYGTTYETDNGYGMHIMLGKEWWVSENWGLGVAGQLLYASCPDPVGNGDKPDLKTTSIGVLFSATYN
ncbi:MAG: hypothetical protein HGB26_06725 [Desulfobulbaceae bacterium]|nr:hypothetical protein [Desulfobulbaceae bacterium]